METESLLLWGLIFGSVGLGYFIYGRRQEKLIPKYSGIALMFLATLLESEYVAPPVKIYTDRPGLKPYA
jgi:hypothetical protein